MSLVDDGMAAPAAPEQIAKALGADGVIIRALQPEGRSRRAAGQTQVWARPDAQLGSFPTPAYRELAGFAPPSLNIDSFGRVVAFLGDAAQ